MNTGISFPTENDKIHSSDEYRSNNFFYDNTEFNDNYYKNFLDVFKYNNSDSLSENENIEVEKTKDKSSDIKSNHIEKEKKEKQLLGKKHLKDNSKNYSKNSKSHKNEVSDENNSIKKKEIIFEVIHPNYRFGHYIKAFKVNFLTYILNNLRNLYEKCNFDNEFGNMTFHLPNYKKYQGNAKQKDNKEFIKKQIKEVFQDYDVNEIEGTSRQKDNKYLIEKIYEIINFPSTAEQKALKDFLEMTIEKAIEKYYDSSEEFQDFKKIRKIIFFDRQFYKEKYRNYSLLDKKNGFLRLVNEPYYCHNPK
jgi:hypothetical protein